jgi:hypothetical protein
MEDKSPARPTNPAPTVSAAELAAFRARHGREATEGERCLLAHVEGMRVARKEALNRRCNR